MVEGVAHRFHAAVADLGPADAWQRADVGVALVGSSPHVLTEVADEIERFVWSFPEHEVLRVERSWLDPD